MTGNEIMVALVFLILGYWIVTAFLNRNDKPPAPPPQSPPPESPPPAEKP